MSRGQTNQAAEDTAFISYRSVPEPDARATQWFRPQDSLQQNSEAATYSDSTDSRIFLMSSALGLSLPARASASGER